ncbi:MAG: histidine phosphotransferase family protein [Roseovarius sp.]
MPSPSTENLVALLGSRICHDLSSPIGAVSNGLELLSLSGVPDSPEMSLVADSAANARARISLFRLAFGMASPDQITRRDEICDIWPAAMAGRRLDLNWHAPSSLPRQGAQLVVLALLCLDKALPQGGALGVSEQNGVWSLCATAPVLRLDQLLWEALSTGQSDHVDPANVQFLLLPYYLELQGKRCDVRITQDSVTLAF